VADANQQRDDQQCDRSRDEERAASYHENATPTLVLTRDPDENCPPTYGATYQSAKLDAGSITRASAIAPMILMIPMVVFLVEKMGSGVFFRDS
jgi:hypothetical protein